MDQDTGKRKRDLAEKGICPECEKGKLIPSGGNAWETDRQDVEYKCNNPECGITYHWFRFKENIRISDNVQVKNDSE
jgi:hypothetical protein